MANEVLKGRYSMRIVGYTLDEPLEIPGARIKDPVYGQMFGAPLKVLEPIAAFAVAVMTVRGDRMAALSLEVAADDPAGGDANLAARITDFAKFLGLPA
jgi:hypothetical protein